MFENLLPSLLAQHSLVEIILFNRQNFTCEGCALTGKLPGPVFDHVFIAEQLPRAEFGDLTIEELFLSAE
jgi:hypothetical protein